MQIRKLIAAALLLAAPVSLLPTAVAAQTEAAAPSVAELLEITSFDQVFTHSGSAMAEAPALHGIPLPAEMERAWREAALEVFVAERMHARLAAALESLISATEAGAVAEFFSTPLGRKIGRLDRSLVMLEPEAIQQAMASGSVMLSDLEPRRLRQFDEMLALVSADLAATMAAQSVRGMLIGMSLAPQRGDIEIPWSEIDAQLEAIMGSIEADVAASQRALMAFGYSGLGDAELEEYLTFLRTPAARKFYSLAMVAVAGINNEAMADFGEALMTKLGSVGA